MEQNLAVDFQKDPFLEEISKLDEHILKWNVTNPVLFAQVHKLIKFVKKTWTTNLLLITLYDQQFTRDSRKESDTTFVVCKNVNYLKKIKGFFPKVHRSDLFLEGNFQKCIDAIDCIAKITQSQSKTFTSELRIKLYTYIGRFSLNVYSNAKDFSYFETCLMAMAWMVKEMNDANSPIEVHQHREFMALLTECLALYRIGDNAHWWFQLILKLPPIEKFEEKLIALLFNYLEYFSSETTKLPSVHLVAEWIQRHLQQNKSQNREIYLQRITTLYKFDSLKEVCVEILSKWGDVEVNILDQDKILQKTRKLYSKSLVEKYKYFERMLNSDMTEAQTKCINIVSQQNWEIVDRVITCMYTDQLDINHDNCFEILFCADQYEILGLKKRAEEQIENNSLYSYWTFQQLDSMWHAIEATCSKRLKKKIVAKKVLPAAVACIQGGDENIEKVKLMCAKYSTVVEMLNTNNHVDFQELVAGGQMQMLELLVELGVGVNQLSTTPLLTKAIRMQRLEYVDKLISLGANPMCEEPLFEAFELLQQVTNSHDDHLPSKEDCLQVIWKLLTSGANTFENVGNFRKVLKFTIEQHYNEIFKCLILQLHNITIGAYTLLAFAVTQNNTEVVKLLLDEGLNPDYVPNGSRAVATQDFLMNTSSKLLTFFKGDLITILDDSNPDWWIGELNGKVGEIRRHHCEITDKPVTDRDVRPLSLAMIHDDPFTFDLLLRAGAQPNILSESVLTPLMWAAGRGYLHLVQLLLNTPNLDPFYKDKDCNKAISLAISNNHPDVAQLLTQHRTQLQSSNSSSTKEEVESGDVTLPPQGKKDEDDRKQKRKSIKLFGFRFG